jgi:hypothetical protein
MSLEAIKTALLCDDFAAKASRSVYEAFAKVLDEDETLDDICAPAKTFIGTSFEKRLLKSLGLPCNAGKATKHLGLKHDTRIAGYDLDIKFTVGNNWMIGPECISAYCLLARADYDAQTFSIGLIHAVPENLTPGANRDKKKTVSKAGKSNISWLVVDEPIKA